MIVLSIFGSKNKTLRLGLCLSKRNIALVLLDCSQAGQPKVKDSFYFDFSDAKGGLSSCQSQLREFVERHNLKNSDCYAVLNKEDYQLLLIEPPEVPEEEVADAMRWKVKDLANVDIESTVIATFPQPEKKMHYTVVAEKNTLSRVIDFVKECNFSLVSIDIEELSYRNYFEIIAQHKRSRTENDNNTEHQDSDNVIADHGIAVISIGENEGKLLIIKGGNLFLSRRFSINYGAGVFDTLPEDEIILELQRSLDYYERQMRQSAPAEILFFGAIEDEKITSEMRNSFQQKMTCIDVNLLLGEHIPNMGIDTTLLLSGAALRGMAA